MAPRATILLLRPRDRLPESRRLCTRLGLRVVAAPALEPRTLRTPRSPPADMAVFTSRRAAEALGDRDFSRLRHAEVWAIGPDTARALRGRGVKARIPPVHSSAGLARVLRPRARGKRVVLYRSRQGDPTLARGLRTAGASVRGVALYTLERSRGADLRRAVRAAAQRRVDIFTFTSAGSAESFLEVTREEGLEGRVRESMSRGVVAALGEPTRRALRRRGVRVDFVPVRTDFGALVRGARALYRKKRPQRPAL